VQPSRILSERWQTFAEDHRVRAARARLMAAGRQAKSGVVRVAGTASRLRPTFAERHYRAARRWVGRKLPRRFHAITHELAKFGTIGLINLGVNFAVVNVLWFTILSGSQVKAKAVATVVAATSAYFMNRHWTYKDRPKSTLRREYTLFFFFNLVGLVIEVAVLYGAKYGLHQTNLLVLNLFTAVGIVVGTVFRFWAYRTHVFKVEPVPGSAEAAIATPYEIVDVVPDSHLRDELAQIELDTIVADERRSTSSLN
jgi:putative flippase GtrA